MKTILAFFFAGLLFWSPLGASPMFFGQNQGAAVTPGFQTASDSFNYTDGTSLQSASSNWTLQGGGGLSVRNNGTLHGVRSSVPGIATCYFYNQLTWSPNQACQFYYVNIDGTTPLIMGVTVRASGTGGVFNCYTLSYNAGVVHLGKYNSGTGVDINTYSLTLTSGQGLRLEVTGSGSATRLTVKKDVGSGWVVVASGVDPGGTYISSGSPGLTGYDNVASSTDLTSWFATEI